MPSSRVRRAGASPTRAAGSPARAIGLALALAIGASCAGEPPPPERENAARAFVVALPPGFAPPPAPAANPPTRAKVRLGRLLFYDPRLSGPGTQACASCHRQELAFSDGRARAVGATGALHPRSAMSLTNVAYLPRLGWAEPALDSLEDQALVPLLNQTPVEMGLAGREAEVMQRLASTELYPPLFAEAFPGEASPIHLENVTRALASFERTLVSGRSPYDRLLFQDDRDALSASARRGMRLFFSDTTRCSRCHGGLHFAGAPPSPTPPSSTAALLVDTLYHNTALYDVDGRGGYPAPNEGLARTTQRPEDMGRFRAPTLRNIAVTAPYMHDGSIATLEEVVEHYAAGGRASGNAHKSAELVGFALDARTRRDLVAFLESLTDPHFLSDPSLADPFAASARDDGPIATASHSEIERRGAPRGAPRPDRSRSD